MAYTFNHSQSLREVTKVTKAGIKAETMKDNLSLTCTPTTHPGLLHNFSYTAAQVYLPRDGTAQSRLDLPLNQQLRKFPTDMQTDRSVSELRLNGNNPQLRFPLPR